MSIYDDLPNLATLDAFFKCERHLFLHKNVLVSISGGSDSDIVLDFIFKVLGEKRNNYDCNLHFVFFDTGIEYNATKRHLQYLETKYKINIYKMKAILPVPQGCKKYGVPFLSKYASEMISRLQKHHFDFANGGGLFEDLYNQYPKCKAALRWWCNEHGKRSSYNINRFYMLREFMIENPPTFFISCECCFGAKKKNAEIYEKENNIDLCVLGLRKAEGGIRTVSIGSCFTEGNDGDIDTYRPIWWFTNKDKEQYELKYNVVHSDCYSVYGLLRTGCAGCPFGSGFETELKIIQEHEPKLYKAVCNIFGESYGYTRKYREFAREHKNGTNKNQLSLFDYEKEAKE